VIYVDDAATLQIGEFEYKTNTEFQQCAESVSKAVNLNELYAAHLVILAIPQAQKFDRSQSETAIYLHYSRRQYLFASLLQIVRLVANSSTEDSIRKFLLDYVTKLCRDGTAPDGKAFPIKIVEAMKLGRDDVVRLDEIQRNRTILRNTTTGDTGESLSESLRLKRKFVAQEIDTMALILHGLVRLKFVKEKDIEGILKELKAAEKLDILSANWIAPSVSWLCQLCDMDENITADTPSPVLPPFGGVTLKRIHSLVITKPPDTWKLPMLGAYIQLYWLSCLNGICKLKDNAAAEFTYESDILGPAHSAVKSGGFDFAITYILKPVRTGVFTPPLRSEITQFLSTRKFPSQPIDQFEIIFISQDSKDLSTYQLEHLVQLFISHLADVLKQIRHVEEDKGLAEGSMFDYSEQSLQHSNNEERDFSLEVFFLFISQLHSNRPDSGQAFLSDPDSALYGFLNWASGVKPVPMLWTFIDLMASLAEGPNCSLAVDKLFSQDTSNQPRSKRFYQSWEIIFGAIQYYAENLSPTSTGNASIGRTPVMYDRLEIEEESTVVLKSYLRLIRHVAASLHESKITLLSKNEDRVLSVCARWS
jgi:nuclear pore complex protein Nup205